MYDMSFLRDVPPPAGGEVCGFCTVCEGTIRGGTRALCRGGTRLCLACAERLDMEGLLSLCESLDAPRLWVDELGICECEM